MVLKKSIVLRRIRVEDGDIRREQLVDGDPDILHASPVPGLPHQIHIVPSLT